MSEDYLARSVSGVIFVISPEDLVLKAYGNNGTSCHLYRGAQLYGKIRAVNCDVLIPVGLSEGDIIKNARRNTLALIPSI